MVIIRIEDNGRGVPDHIKERIFDSFLSSKSEGSGLGLSIVRRIMRSHDGDITLVQSDNKGTIFELSLPQAKSRL